MCDVQMNNAIFCVSLFDPLKLKALKAKAKATHQSQSIETRLINFIFRL